MSPKKKNPFFTNTLSDRSMIRPAKTSETNHPDSRMKTHGRPCTKFCLADKAHSVWSSTKTSNTPTSSFVWLNMRNCSFLFYTNTKLCAFFVVCNYLRTNTCSLKSSVNRFIKSIGTSGLKRHSETNSTRAMSNKIHTVDVTADMKWKLSNSAAQAVLSGDLTFTFCGDPVMVHYQQGLVENGQSLP